MHEKVGTFQPQEPPGDLENVLGTVRQTESPCGHGSVASHSVPAYDRPHARSPTQPRLINGFIRFKPSTFPSLPPLPTRVVTA